MVTPVIRSLVAEGAEVFAIAERPWADVVASLPGVKGTLSVSNGNPGYWECLRIGLLARRWKCDTALVLRFSNRAALIARIAGCRSRVGAVAKCRRFWKLTRNINEATHALAHQVDKYYAVADAAAGIDLPRVPALYVPKGSVPNLPEKFITVHLGNGGSNHEWTPRRYAALVARLKEAGRAVVVTGDAQERGSHGEVIALADRDLVGMTSLDALAGVFARSIAVIALDGGGGRLASAIGTPVVSLAIGYGWSRSTMMPWMAPGEVVEPSVRCAECSPGKCTLTGTTCSDNLHEEQVLEALQRLMT